MARLKPQIKQIESLEQADLVLKEIGLLERQLETIDGEAQKRINEIKVEALKEGEFIRNRITELSSMLGSFADNNKHKLFIDKRTVELTFGCFGFRKSTSIHVKKTTLELLKKLGLTQFIRVKEEPNKEALAEMDDETLAQVDAVRKVKDEFFCEANQERINQELLGK